MMNGMNGIRILAAAGILLVGCLFGGDNGALAILSRPVKCPEFGKREKILNAKVPMLVEKLHYSHRAMTPALSREWFQEYFKYLDPQKVFFVKGDIDELRPYEEKLCDIRAVNVRLAFLQKAYLRFLSRVKNYAEYSIKCLDEEMDYSLDETLERDRGDAPWCESEAALQDLWRRRVKESLLVDMLEREDEAVARVKAGGAKKDDGTSFKPVPARERLARMYATAYEYRLDVEGIDVLEGFLNAFTMMFDPHTSYMAPDTKENFDIHMSLSLQGIGATLSMKESYCEIVALAPGGPADRQGTLKEGDRIVEVCQEGQEPVNVVGMNLKKIVKQIRGPKGTTVMLTVLEADTGSTKHVRIVRDKVVLQDAEASSSMHKVKKADGTDANILVLYLPTFYADFAAMQQGNADYKSSSRDVRKMLEAAVAAGPLDGVVLDFRGNGGGSLADAVNLAGLFFKSGPVVQTRNAAGAVRQLADRYDDCVYTGPLFVMVDKYSASASEIVAAALQDMGRALVVGSKTTHGKGTVQQAFDLDTLFSWNMFSSAEPQGALKLTNQKFYRISGGSTQLKGVSSDIVFPCFEDVVEKTGEGKLPHALPWDEIAGTTYPKFMGFRPVLKSLDEISRAHRQESALFREYMADIAAFGKVVNSKTVSLNYEKRKEERRRTLDATAKVRKFAAQHKQARARVTRKMSDKALQEEKDARDIILEETLFLMGQYLEMAR